MKRLIIIGMVCLLVSFQGKAFAGEKQEIELDDGSVIHGEIVSLQGDVFSIKSDTLGIIQIKASKVRNIQKRNASGGAGDSVEELRRTMMSNPEILEMILALQNDPDVLAVLQDFEIMKSLNSGDIAALTSNPKFIRLLNNPKVQGIGKKVQR